MTTLDSFIEYDNAPLDDLPSEDLHTVEGMRRRGRPARRLADGFPEWQRARLPVELKTAS